MKTVVNLEDKSKIRSVEEEKKGNAVKRRQGRTKMEEGGGGMKIGNLCN